MKTSKKTAGTNGAQRCERHGIALVLVLLILIVMAGMGMILIQMSGAASHEVEVIRNHLACVAVGESVFAQITARLSATPWPQRWFKDGAEVMLEQPSPTGEGTYESMIRDARPRAVTGDPLADASLFPPNQADLMIRASSKGSTVTMYWRLSVSRDSLEGVRRVVPAFFTFAPDETRPRTPDLDDLATQVVTWIQKRQGNLSRFQPLLRPLVTVVKASDLETILDMRSSGPVIDEVSSITKGLPRPNPPYLTVARTTPSPLTVDPRLAEVPPASFAAPIPRTVSDTLQAIDSLRSRLEKIACYFDPQITTGVGPGSRARNWLTKADRFSQKLTGSTAAQPASESDRKLIQEGNAIVSNAQKRLGYDPIQIQCP